jgi:hypothetical protein
MRPAELAEIFELTWLPEISPDATGPRGAPRPRISGSVPVAVEARSALVDRPVHRCPPGQFNFDA